MCSPLALTAGTTAAGLINENAKAQYSKQAYKQAKQAAENNALREYGALQERQAQENATAAQAIAKNAEQARLAIGSAATSTAEAGVAGNAAASLIQDFERTSLEYEHTVTRNKAFLDAQFAREAQGVWSNEQAEILRALPEPPNYFGVLVGGAADYFKLKIKEDAKNP